MSFAKFLSAFLLLPAIARAQTMPNMPGMQHDTPATPGWHWAEDASAFYGFNGQERKFRDFHAWESQNWLMVDAVHSIARGTFRATAMTSLEPFTLHEIGSPQVFQTGETFRSAPLKDYQHPHDLIMGLGADYTRTSGAIAYYAGADLVGSPPEAAGSDHSVRCRPAHGLDLLHESRAPAQRVDVRLRAEPRDSRELRGLPVRGDDQGLGTPPRLHARGIGRQGHPRRRLPPARRVPSASPLAGRRADRRLPVQRPGDEGWPENLQDSYGSPSSYHVFVHYSLRGENAGHVH